MKSTPENVEAAFDDGQTVVILGSVLAFLVSDKYPYAISSG